MWRRVPGYKDKDATRQLAASLERRAERRQAGLIGPFDDAARRPLTEHLDDYERHLEAKGDGVDHVHRTKRRIQALFDSCGFRRTRDLSASKVATELASRRKAGLSIQTSNYYLTAIKSFCRWMVRDRRLPDNPLAHLSALNTATDEKRERRCATTEEFTTLLEVTGTAPAAARLQGRDRAILYVLAAYTGFRASELASLTTDSFSLKGDAPSVTVEAAYSKHRRRDVQPLPADLVPVLRAWLEERTSTGRLWPGKWYRRAAEMLQVDLTRAGVAYMDERGRYLDFHALRHTYITSLHRGGVYGKLLQTLARHSTSRLTERYTHVELSDIAGAIEGLPPLPTAKPKQKKRRA